MVSSKSRRGREEGIVPSSSVLDEVRSILDEASKRSENANRFCSGLADCCRFRLTGETPYVTLGETWVVWKEWKKAGRTKVTLPSDGSCSFLNEVGRCLIYEGRPLACRTHFCISAGGVLPRREVLDLIRTLEDIDYRLGGNGPSRLPEAVARLAKKR